MPPLAAILIYAVAAVAQWQGHGSRARHAALYAALTALPVLLRHAMSRAGVQLFAAARPLRLRAGHGTGVEAPLLRGPRVQAGVSRVARRVN